MGVELVPTPKAPKNRSLAIRFIAKVLSTAHAPIWSQRPRAQNAGYGEQPLVWGFAAMFVLIYRLIEFPLSAELMYQLKRLLLLY